MAISGWQATKEDAAYTKVYEILEADVFTDMIELPTIPVLKEHIGNLLKPPVRRPTNERLECL